MEEMVSLSIRLHLIFVILLVLLLGINLYWLKSDRTFFNLSKRLELLAPQYYIVLSAIFFTYIQGGYCLPSFRNFSLYSFRVQRLHGPSHQFGKKLLAGAGRRRFDFHYLDHMRHAWSGIYYPKIFCFNAGQYPLRVDLLHA